MRRQLRELADIHYGKSPNEVLHDDGVIPVVGTGGVYGSSLRPLFQGPAVVVPRKGSLGNPQYMPGPFWAVDTTYAVLPKKGVHGQWLYYNLDFFDLTKLNEATGVPSISRDWLSKIEFEDSGEASQKHIADILGTVDEAIKQTQALIAKTQQIKAGLMHDLFTRGVTADGQLRPPHEDAPQLYKESELGWIPKEWTLRPLEVIAEVNRGKFTIRPRNDPRYYNGEFPFIQTGDVALSAGRVLSKYSQTLNQLGLSVSRLFPAGTIMVTIAANIADTCILGIPMCAPDSLVGVVPKTGEATRFIELAIRLRKRWFENRAPQTAQKNINLDDLKPMLVPYPETDEQYRIAARYEAIDAQLMEYEEDIAKLAMYKCGLMQDLLTGRVAISASQLSESSEVATNV